MTVKKEMNPPKARRSSNFGRIHFAAIRKSLLHRNCLDALLVAASGKLRCKELVKALTTGLLVNEAAWEDDDIGIVVLADEVGNFGLPDEAGADALVLVERHRDTFARAAHCDAGIDLAALNSLGQSMAKSRVVARLFGQRTVVLELHTFLFKVLLYKLLQWKGGMVAGQSYNLNIHFL